MRERLLRLRRQVESRLAATAAGRWYGAQAPRDQRMLALLSGFMACVLVYLVFWLPIQDALLVAEGRYADAMADQRWIQMNRTAAAEAAARRSSTGSGRSGQALLSTVAGSARSAGLTLNRFQPDGGDALAVSLDDVAFSELVPWLETLAREQGIGVRQASIDVRDQPGRVRVRLVLY